ncbi:hypothetical protein [Staphylococcus sp. E463]|nr:hypothetical protein [Staphylococcus sp. E463]
MKINKWVFASVATVSLLGMANPVYASGNGQTNNGQYDQQSTQSSSNQNQ